jgi:hypothetical protein
MAFAMLWAYGCGQLLSVDDFRESASVSSAASPASAAGQTAGATTSTLGIGGAGVGGNPTASGSGGGFPGVSSTGFGPASTSSTKSSSSTGMPTHRYIFLSSKQFDGSIDGDKECSSLGATLGSGIFKAWLATASVKASCKPGSLYFLPNNVSVGSCDALTFSGPSTPINVTETGTPVPPGLAWTGAKSDGTFSGDNCKDWKTKDIDFQGSVGDYTQASLSWSNNGMIKTCAMPHRIYCVEQ